MVGNPAYDVVHVQGSAGDRLGLAYNMDSNPLYEAVTPDRPHVYENVDNQ